MKISHTAPLVKQLVQSAFEAATHTELSCLAIGLLESNSVPPYLVSEERKCVGVATSDSSLLASDCTHSTSGDQCNVVSTTGYTGSASTLMCPSGGERLRVPQGRSSKLFSDLVCSGRYPKRYELRLGRNRFLGIFSCRLFRLLRAGRRYLFHEDRRNSFALVVEDRNASRRRQESTSTSSRIVLKLWTCGWSGDAWDPALAYILMSSVETTDKRFEVEVPSTAVLDMSGVSRSTSVSMVGAVQADPSQPTLHVEALSPGNLSTKLVSVANISLTFHEDADGSIAVHPIT